MRASVKGLTKDPVQRNKYDNENLYAFFKGVKCFKDLKIGMNDLLKVINVTRCVFVPRNEVLFRHGDHGTAFFVCISGKCQLFIWNP